MTFQLGTGKSITFFYSVCRMKKDTVLKYLKDKKVPVPLQIRQGAEKVTGQTEKWADG